MRSRLTLLIAAALPALLFVAQGASAQDMDSFRSPSGNIGCMLFDDILRCDLGSVSNPQPARPADCDLDWGSAFQMAAASRHAERICHGDTALDPAARVLGYGTSWEGGGFSCISSERGLSCRNARGAGWDLARGAQKLH